MKSIEDYDVYDGSKVAVSDLSLSSGDTALAGKFAIIGYIVSALFFGSVVMWATFIPISSAAIASGIVGKEGYRKTVQHLEGGIIHAIHVKDGDHVTAGQKVIELSNVSSRSDFELLQKEKSIAVAKQASIVAAQQGRSEVTLPPWLVLENLERSVLDVIMGQREAFKVAERIHQEKLEIITLQLDSARKKIKALHNEKRVLKRSRALIRNELREYTQLQNQGLVPRSQVFDLKRQIVDNDLRQSESQVSLESMEQDINDLRMKQSELNEVKWKRLETELDKTREEIVRLDEHLSKTADTLERTIIRAATTGVVVNMQVNTRGGVIMPGQPLLDIVPSSGSLIVDARINHMDRDKVHMGQQAEIRFSAFNMRLTAPVPGEVTHISADRIIDAISNESYYRAKIALKGDPETVMNGGSIYPGMQAEVFIITGSRTALSYLTVPITKSFNRAFKDD